VKALVTGAAGFIGSHFVHKFHSKFDKIVIVDKLTYAADLKNLEPLLSTLSSKIELQKFDIIERERILEILRKEQITSMIHFAAESHVDNSITGPQKFIETNICGTVSLLEATREYLKTHANKEAFTFLHVSTDEVFGSLDETGQFSEATPYDPRSPYSASKAASDHLVRAWGHTYGIPYLVTNCSNNFGPHQHHEKLIPVVINKCFREEPIPVYGNGSNVRDWIWAEEHCEGIYLALTKGRRGETYCFGGDNEWSNLNLVQTICDLMQEYKAPKKVANYRDLIQFVTDRPGHDWRYSIDSSKAKRDLGFQNHPEKMRERLLATIRWYAR
jgi:dTDP-glucose 4,6-dehydratase